MPVVSRFPGKKLPAGWTYVPSRREVHELARPLDVRSLHVDLDGTGSGPSAYGRLLLGYVERRVVDGAWCFHLRLWGVREADIVTVKPRLARAAIEAIGGYLQSGRGRPHILDTIVYRPTQPNLPSLYH